ncbi:MAG: DUF4493 domain-containing protein [Alistipes sp.]|nr:DUF4493 domain-containing protein [Alistipes sp.]
MKRLIYPMLAAAVFSCSKEPAPVPGDGLGVLNPEVQLLPVVDADTRAQVDITSLGFPASKIPQGKQMRLRIINAQTGGTRVWDAVSQYSPVRDLLPAGNRYRAQVGSRVPFPDYSNSDAQLVDGGELHKHQPSELIPRVYEGYIGDGYDSLYFEGWSEIVTILPRYTGSDGEGTTVVTPCPIAAHVVNTLVTIEFTDNFKNYFPNGANFRIETLRNSFPRTGTPKIGYDAGAADSYVPAVYYLRPYSFRITGEAVKATPAADIDPVTVRFAETVNASPAPQTLYRYRFDVSGIGGGDSSGITITLNGEPVDTDDTDHELNPDARP